MQIVKSICALNCSPDAQSVWGDGAQEGPLQGPAGPHISQLPSSSYSEEGALGKVLGWMISLHNGFVFLIEALTCPTWAQILMSSHL